MDGRPNDLAGDNAGGAYFTQRCLYHAGAPAGSRSSREIFFGNGIVLSPDDTMVYVTNYLTVVAFDLAFAGADRKTLYVIGNGAHGLDGKPAGSGARTIYKLPMLAQGVSGRGK